MAASYISLFIFSLIICSLSTSSISTNPTKDVQYDWLKVPNSEFTSSVNLAMNAIRGVTSIISQFSNVFGDFRVSTAISDCLDLLDSSIDALSWSLSTNQNPKGKHNSTGDLGSDMKTFLSAALANQDTCMEGFDGTNTIVKNLIGGSISQVNSFVLQLLSMVQPVPLRDNDAPLSHRKTTGGKSEQKNMKDNFPAWMSKRDRKLVQAPSIGVSPDFTVALDGSGGYTNISAAILAVPDTSTRRYVIYVKRGVYKENVEIKKKKWNIMMIGDGIDATIITGNRNFIDGWTTFRSATFAVSGKGFIARDMTFENTAGPEKHQAVAVRSDSDLAVYFRCSFKGYQDTLYTHAFRQFFRECKISGTVDFIFGDAAVVFQNCQILAKKGLPNQKNTITAQGRKDPNEPTGFSIQFCNISADSDLLNSVNSTLTYFGRPWKLYSRTVIMQSYISNAIRPEGWLEWNGNFALNSLFYGEYSNYGPGAGVGGRVKWPGFHVINDTAQATNYTVSQFIKGDLWLPLTGVRYTSGLAV